MEKHRFNNFSSLTSETQNQVVLSYCSEINTPTSRTTSPCKHIYLLKPVHVMILCDCTTQNVQRPTRIKKRGLCILSAGVGLSESFLSLWTTSHTFSDAWEAQVCHLVRVWEAWPVMPCRTELIIETEKSLQVWNRENRRILAQGHNSAADCSIPPKFFFNPAFFQSILRSANKISPQLVCHINI